MSHIEFVYLMKKLFWRLCFFVSHKRFSKLSGKIIVFEGLMDREKKLSLSSLSLYLKNSEFLTEHLIFLNMKQV
jgi:hypothetical protein